MQVLEQKARDYKRSFKIKPEGVEVEVKQVGKSQKYFVRFDEIRNDEWVTLMQADLVVWGFLFSVLLNLVLITGLLIHIFKIGTDSYSWVFSVLMGGIIAIGIGFKNHFEKVHIKVLEANKPLEFIYSKKYKAAVDDFIALIKEQRTDFLKDKYFKIDSILPFEHQKNTMLWLYQTEIISQQEYIDILGELKIKKVIDDQ